MQFVFVLEIVPVHQLRRVAVAAPRGQGADAQPAPGTNHFSVPKERQKGTVDI